MKENEIARFGPLHMLVGSKKVLFIAESKARVSWFFSKRQNSVLRTNTHCHKCNVEERLYPGHYFS